MPDNATPLPWTGTADKGSYYRLFIAYILSLLATGVATVALALVAYDLAGQESGAILGTALSIKMLAYIIAAPLVGVLVRHLPRKPLLLTLDIVRAGSLLLLPFVTTSWQAFALVFVFSLASGVFTLVYQTVVPYLLANQQDYTQSLARSQVAGELEASMSPLLAAGLLLIFAPAGVFFIAAVAFLLSAWLILRMRIPGVRRGRGERFGAAFLRGPRLFLATPRLRGLIALDVAASFASAMVLVNTVVIVQGIFAQDRHASAIAFATFGFGSICGAVVIPPLLRTMAERRIMLTGATLLSAGLVAGALVSSVPALLGLWFVIGLGCTLALTPAAYMIRRTAPPEDLPLLFASQLALTSSCLLVAYSAAGWLGATAGLSAAFAVMGAVSCAASFVAARLWPPMDTPTAPPPAAEGQPH